jgi:propionyl-CoA carboxylase alpha chain
VSRPGRPLTKVLVANRGEIARRVIRTLRAMGIASVAVYSDADVDAPHVREADEAARIGPAPSTESYLAIDRLLEAARRTGADALHPGYGFLSENAEFAAACTAAGLTFIGPPADAIRAMGSKIEAKRLMASAGVPTIPGTTAAGLSDAQLVEHARVIGFPILVKASAGGGGKGMRIVRDEAGLASAVAAARREAARAFGDDALLLERYIDTPRHIEIQVFGDHHGQVIHLGERECSIQRRHQKVIEEAPSVAVDAALREQMGAAAVAATRAIGYVGAGTVEFVLDPAGAFYFLEVNTRLQVEHPVTELVTGLDLVEWQVRVARGEPLPWSQADFRFSGHAIEARLYAEDAGNDFLPATGTVRLWAPPAIPGVRYDSGVEAGSVIGIDYDPMLAKVIAHGATRAEAVGRLSRALRGLGIAGLTTNRDFLVQVLEHPAFAAGALDTHFIERHLPAAARAIPRNPEVDRTHAIVAAVAAHDRRRDGGSPVPPSLPSGWRNNRWRPQQVRYRIEGEEYLVEYVAAGDGSFSFTAGGQDAVVRRLSREPDASTVEIDGLRREYQLVHAADTTWAPPNASRYHASRLLGAKASGEDAWPP